VDDPTENLDRRRASFLSASADDYDRHRPSYPIEAVHWAIGENRKTILDVGCGPGKLTEQLIALADTVIGIDPSAEMLRTMKSKGLLALRGVVEALPVGTNSTDVVTVATAFHWFDHKRAVCEFSRVLVPGGRLAILTSFRDESVGWVDRLSRIIGSETAMSATLGGEQGLEAQFHEWLTHEDLFDSVEHKVFALDQQLDEEGLAGLVGTRSYVAVLPEKKREELLSAVLALCREHPDLKDKGRFTLPYRTHAFRCRVKERRSGEEG
jgi:ubiquinone/menaquinone biosynthesis C-methylase UbiE